MVLITFPVIVKLKLCVLVPVELGIIMVFVIEKLSPAGFVIVVPVFAVPSNVKVPEVIDIDKDGLDEIFMRGSNWGGTCTFDYNFYALYSPFYSDTFSVQTGSEADANCEFHPIEPVFSPNLDNPEVQTFRAYLKARSGE